MVCQSRLCPICSSPVPELNRTYCSVPCWHAGGKGKAHKSQPTDPTPAEIAEECARIRATWDEAEHQRRLRVDWRDVVYLHRSDKEGPAPGPYDEDVSTVDDTLVLLRG